MLSSRAQMPAQPSPTPALSGFALSPSLSSGMGKVANGGGVIEELWQEDQRGVGRGL